MTEVVAFGGRSNPPLLARSSYGFFARAIPVDQCRLAHAGGEAWSWNANPFVGTHELNGLKILMMLTSNWDAKDARDGEGSNTAVYTKPGSASKVLY